MLLTTAFGLSPSHYSAAHSSPVASSWGFARFVNVRDGKGATPLHLAARQRRPDCVHILLENGALVNALTGGYGFAESSPLHWPLEEDLWMRRSCLRGEQIDCKRSSGESVHGCAEAQAWFMCCDSEPSAAEPLVWPSPLKFISELGPEAKVLLERALMAANREEGEEHFEGVAFSPPSPLNSHDGVEDNISETSESELCCICFDQVCSIEVQDCGHQMCAHCTLTLCCHKKPNASGTGPPFPVFCPFCRSNIAKLVVAKTKSETEMERENNTSRARKSRKSRNLSEGGSSFKSLSAMGSFGKMGGHGSGRIASGSDDCADKP